MSKSRRKKIRMAAVKQSDMDFEIAFYQSILETTPDFIQALMALGNLYTKKGWYERGLNVDKKLARLRPDSPYVFYNLACSNALMGDILEGVKSLIQAFELGFSDIEYMAQDKDLTQVYHHPHFQEYFIAWKEKAELNKVSLRRVV